MSAVVEVETPARFVASEGEDPRPADPPRNAAQVKPTTGRKRSKARIVLPALIAVALTGGGAAYALGHGKEKTDDAQVEGHVASVSARVSGQVARVLVRDNQAVKPGDVLVELDAKDLLARLAAARADLAAAEAQLHAAEAQLPITERVVSSDLAMARGGMSQAQAVQGTTRASIDQAQADLAAAESRQGLARLELTRTQTLVQSGALSSAELDSRRSAAEQADAAVEQAKARLASARAATANSSGTIEAARGRYLAAQSGPEQVAAARAQVELAKARVQQSAAALEQAELNLSYTKIRAQVAGVIARRSVEVGQLVAPERPLMAIVPLDDTWVVANFKEDQIARMTPGQNAKVSVDAYSGQSFSGHVDSLAGGTGSRFSLLPPDNASGNFTKVVQRVPVLIRLEPHPAFTLRPGMSATVTVRTE